MKVQFFIPHAAPYDATTVRQRPTGGTERSTIFLGEALARLGHEVRWATTWAALEEVDGEWADVVLTQHAEVFTRFSPRARRVWWCHQFTDRPFINEQAKHARRHADDVVVLSLFHQRDFHRNLGMESVVIGYGLWHDEIVVAPKDPTRLIYCSVPHRGLELMPDLFAEIRREEPTATLTVCSSMATWGSPEEDAHFADLFARLAAMDGVQVRGGLAQPALWRELATASVFFYPCTYQETYCMAMDEAMAHGCVPVIPPIGALPERWPPTQRLARQAVYELRAAAARPRPVPRPLDWSVVAEKWVSLLQA